MKITPESIFSGEFQNIPDLTDKSVVSLLNTSWWPELIEASLPYQDKRDDKGHAACTVIAAAELLELCGSVDRRIVLSAALLHDTGWSGVEQKRRFRLFSADLTDDEERVLRLEHERLGAELAGRLMKEAGCPEDIVEPVCRIINGHDTRKGFLSAEDGIVRDADKLWMISGPGFSADLRRRRLASGEWASVLKERFEKPGELYCDKAREQALAKIAGFSDKIPAARPTVLIAHYRVGWTDGVSLEIEKRRTVLEEMGFRVLLLSGPGSRGADFIIDELDFEAPAVKKIARNMFGELQELSEKELEEEVYRMSDLIEAKLADIFIEVEPDFILTHNIFSHGRHAAAARAFYNVLKNYGASSLTTHHDFYWERDDFRTPSCRWAAEYLESYVPPEIPEMKHAVINSLAAEELEKHSGIKPMVFPDTLDFDVSPWKADDYNSHFYEDFDLHKDDILILQATRIVRRKGIELIPPLVRRLGRPEIMQRLSGKKLFNGKQITSESRFVFLLAGYAEHEAESYQEELRQLMDDEGIEYRFLHPQIAAERGELPDGRRIYSLFDTYPYADLVSYPSLFEGWGNQFLEAVFARKPVVLYEYPVFRADIKPIGYEVVSMGSGAVQDGEGLYKLSGSRIAQCAEQLVDWLLSPETEGRLERNYNLACSNNSYKTLRELMRQSMEHYEDF